MVPKAPNRSFVPAMGAGGTPRVLTFVIGVGSSPQGERSVHVGWGRSAGAASLLCERRRVLRMCDQGAGVVPLAKSPAGTFGAPSRPRFARGAHLVLVGLR